MTLDLKKYLTGDDIIRIFGHNYIVSHYAVDGCIDTGGTSPVYQSSSGPIKYMEYRDRGIAASFVYDDDKMVDAIIFTNKPFGPTHSICAGRGKKK